MDQNKNTQGQQGQKQKQNQGQQNQGQRQGSQGNQNWNRDEAESSSEQTRTGNRGNMGGQERGTGKQGERNAGGISNRGMSGSEEQADLPSGGSDSDDDLEQSER